MPNTSPNRAWLLTQSMVFVSWIFFRLPKLSQATLAFQHLWGQQADIQFAQKIYIDAIGLGRLKIAFLIGILITLMTLVYFFYRGLKLQLNWPVKLLLMPLGLYIVWLLAPQGGQPYIYFDF